MEGKKFVIGLLSLSPSHNYLLHGFFLSGNHNNFFFELCYSSLQLFYDFPRYAIFFIFFLKGESKVLLEWSCLII
jgi:hypothetical protein